MLSHLAIFNLGTPELLLMLAVGLLLFGSKKIPELSRGIGESIQEFKKGAATASELQNDIKQHANQIKDEFKKS